MGILSQVLVILVQDVFYPSNLVQAWQNHSDAFYFSLFHFLSAVLDGNGTLTLARRPDTSTLRCAVLLDQRFTVVMNGSESVVEAIAESTFTFSYDGGEWSKFKIFQDDASRRKSFTAIEGLCEGVCFTALLLFWLLLCPSMSKPGVMPTFLVVFPMPFLPLFFSKLDSPQSPFWRIVYRSFLPLLCLFTYTHDPEATNFFTHIGRRLLCNVTSSLYRQA